MTMQMQVNEVTHECFRAGAPCAPLLWCSRAFVRLSFYSLREGWGIEDCPRILGELLGQSSIPNPPPFIPIRWYWEASNSHRKPLG